MMDRLSSQLYSTPFTMGPMMGDPRTTTMLANIVSADRINTDYALRATTNAVILSTASMQNLYKPYKLVVNTHLLMRMTEYTIIVNYFARHGMHLGVQAGFPIYNVIYLTFGMLFSIVQHIASINNVNVTGLIRTIENAGPTPENVPVTAAILRFLNFINDSDDKERLISSLVCSFYSMQYNVGTLPNNVLLQSGSAENNYLNMITDLMNEIIVNGKMANYANHVIVHVKGLFIASGVTNDYQTCISDLVMGNPIPAPAPARFNAPHSYMPSIVNMTNGVMATPLLIGLPQINIIHPLIIDSNYAPAALINVAAAVDITTLITQMRNTKVFGGVTTQVIRQLKKNTIMSPLSAITTNRVLESIQGDSLFFVPTTGFYENTSLSRIATNFGIGGFTFNQHLLVAVLTTQLQTVYGCYALQGDTDRDEFRYNYTSAINLDGFYVRNLKHSNDKKASAFHSINPLVGGQVALTTALLPNMQGADVAYHFNVQILAANSDRYSTMHTIPVNYGVNAVTGQFIVDKRQAGYLFGPATAPVTEVVAPGNTYVNMRDVMYQPMNVVLNAYGIPNAVNSTVIHKSIYNAFSVGVIAQVQLSLSNLSYYLRCGTKSLVNYNINGMNPIQGAISLPGIKVDQKFTAQGHGPVYEISKFGSSRVAFGYELQDFMEGANVLVKEIVAISTARQFTQTMGMIGPTRATITGFYDAICGALAAYTGEHNNPLINLSVKHAIAKFGGYAGNYVASAEVMLPMANIKTSGTFGDVSSGVRSFMYNPIASYRYHDQACGHIFSTLFNGSNVYIPSIGSTTYTLHPNNPAPFQVAGGIHNITLVEIITRSTQFNPNLAMYVALFYTAMRCYLTTFISSTTRVDLILTNTLFAEYTRENGTSYYIFDALPTSQYMDLFTKIRLFIGFS